MLIGAAIGIILWCLLVIYNIGTLKRGEVLLIHKAAFTLVLLTLFSGSIGFLIDVY